MNYCDMVITYIDGTIDNLICPYDNEWDINDFINEVLVDLRENKFIKLKWVGDENDGLIFYDLIATDKVVNITMEESKRKEKDDI